MRKILAFTLAVLAALFVLTLPAYAGEVATAETEPPEEIVTELVTEPVTETVTETVTEPATEYVTEHTTENPEDLTETVTEPAETETEPAETETAVPIDEWLYGLMQEASPEQVEMFEDIILGGVGALDKLGIKGFDRIRIWVEHNTATVMVIALIVALVCFTVAGMLQKKGLFKKCDILNNNSIEIFEKGQEMQEQANKTAEAAAEALEEVMAMIKREREDFSAELQRNAKVNAALLETVNFLLQCSDLPASKRDEAEAIFQKGMEAMSRDERDEA